MNWSDQQRQNFANEYILSCKLYDKEISFDLAKLIIEDLQDLDADKCKMALSAYRKNHLNKFWPKASDIRQIVSPVASDRDIGNEMARLIDKCVFRHGYMWEHGVCVGEYENGSPLMQFEGKDKKYYLTFKEAALSELGDIGWHIMCSRGGWLNVHQSSNTMDEGQFIAQMRDQVESTIKLQRAGVDLTMIDMPVRQELEHVASNVLSIMPKNKEF